MPELPNRRQRDFSQYDAMDDDQLRQILREDASKPEGEESDLELLLYVMEVLAKRRKQRNEAKNPEEALASFKENYNTNNGISLISDSAAKERSGRSNWRKGLVAAAAIFALIVGSSFTAKALGFDVWETIVKWTQETLHFGETDDSGDPSPDAEQLFASLQEALRKYSVEQDILPTWLPEGYEESDLRIVETPKQRQFFAKYECGDNVIKIWIAEYLEADPLQIEKSGDMLELYESGGVQYYIFSNNGQLRAAWIRDNFECCISGPISLAEIKGMIDSIGKG